MSDAVGGVVNLMLIIVFIVFILLYLAFNVNYQKAFNVKNRIVSIYEERDGKCDETCTKEIKAYEESLGYGKRTLTKKGNENCPSGYGYCVRGIQSKKSVNENIVGDSPTKHCYFEIRTQVEIGIPLINDLLDLKIFQVTGQTTSIKIIDSKNCDQIAAIAK